MRGKRGEALLCQCALAGDEGRQCLYNIHLHGFKAKGAHGAEPGKPLANLQGWLMNDNRCLALLAGPPCMPAAAGAAPAEAGQHQWAVATHAHAVACCSLLV